MGASVWMFIVGLILAPLLLLWSISVIRYRRDRARDAAKWKASWKALAEARALRLEPTFARDLNGGPGFHQTWYTLHGSVESVPYRIGLGIITYGYDGLLMVQAAIRFRSAGILILTPAGASSPLDNLDAVDLPSDGLTLYCDNEQTARAIASPSVRSAVNALSTTGPRERVTFFQQTCGALLVVRDNHVQVILPTTAEALDLETLDAGVNIIAALTAEAAAIGQ